MDGYPARSPEVVRHGRPQLRQPARIWVAQQPVGSGGQCLAGSCLPGAARKRGQVRLARTQVVTESGDLGGSRLPETKACGVAFGDGRPRAGTRSEPFFDDELAAN